MPFGPLQQIFNQAPLFALVLFRVGGLMTLAPILGAMTIPTRIKPFIALVLAMAVFPLVGVALSTVPNSLPGLAVAVAAETLIGLTMGFVLSLLFVGIQLGASLVGQQMGLGFARMVDPLTQVQSNILSQFYLLLATVFYVLMNGHLVLIKALARTFDTIPLAGAGTFFSTAGARGVSYQLVQTMVDILSASFALGIRMAGPGLVAIFLATLALGFIGRTMPQLNILAAGFPVRIVLALVLLIISLGSVSLLMRSAFSAVLAHIGTLFI